MTIITKLQGGLGNQLFQYAAGRSLAERLKTSLLLDEQWFSESYEGVTPRVMLLSKLQTRGQVMRLLHPFNPPKKLRRILQKYLPLQPYLFKEKAEYQFDESFAYIKPFASQDIYLMGYWQSYRYFENIRYELMQEFTPRFALQPHYQDYLNQILSKPSATMMHIRRGDYVHLAAAAKVHGVLGLDYYHRAMNQLLQNEDPSKPIHFFVFSDDIAWAKTHLPHQERLTFIENLANDDAVIEELQLMRACQHHIIANSSLSWWGAWLGATPQQTVICPSRWVNREGLNYDALLPPAWQRLNLE